MRAKFFPYREVVSRRCSFQKVFLKISQNSQENKCARVSFLIIVLAASIFIKKRLWHRCFPVNFADFLRTPFYRTPLVATSQYCIFFLYCISVAPDSISVIALKFSLRIFFPFYSCHITSQINEIASTIRI